MSKEVLARVSAYRLAAQLGGNPEPRLALYTDDAISLARFQIEQGQTLRHHTKVVAAVDAWDHLGESPEHSEAALEHGQAKGRVREAFWDAFEGEPIDGVEILRKRV